MTELRRSKRGVIVTADDFGVSIHVNEAVVEAFQNGVLRHASLMVGEPSAAEAVELARTKCPRMGVGLHLALCGGFSVLGKDVIPELVDSQGRFGDNPVTCGIRYFFDLRVRSAIEKEMRAQFERFLGFGLPPSHVDGHINIHVHPVIFPILVRLCREYGFKRLRLPGGEFGLSWRYSARPFGKQLHEAALFSLLRAYLTRAYGDPRVEILDSTLGLLRSGMMREDYVVHCLENLKEGIHEIYFHPSSDPATAVSCRPTPTHRTFTELLSLTSPKVKEALAKSGVELF